LEVVKIPKSVTHIGRRAFYRCSRLREVDIPDSVKSLGSEVFKDCISLKYVKIPDSVEEMGYGLLDSCENLEEAVLPESLTVIESSTFEWCKKLKTFTLSKNTVKIGESAFMGCRSLEEINIPECTVEIGRRAFHGCDKLKSIKVLTLKDLEENLKYSISLKEIIYQDKIINVKFWWHGIYEIINEINVESYFTGIECYEANRLEYGAHGFLVIYKDDLWLFTDEIKDIDDKLKRKIKRKFIETMEKEEGKKMQII
jgi:hypothetical protein